MKKKKKKKKALVLGGGGFIGGHMVGYLLKKGYNVMAVDIKDKDDWFQQHQGAENWSAFDARDSVNAESMFWGTEFDEVYQLAADMGGAGYIFTGEHDADVMSNSALINLNLAVAIKGLAKKPKIFFSSSACIYPRLNQTDPDNPNCEESSAYPADPDSEYGWEKLFTERLLMSYARNYGFDVRIARFHNVYGPHGSYDDGKEKAPAAMCRKAALATDSFEVWGPGTQTRSFTYIDDCLEGVSRLMESDVEEVINIGSDEMITINDFARMVLELAGKKDVKLENIEGPVGVNGRNSDNRLIRKLLGWAPEVPLREGMAKTLEWITFDLKAQGRL